MSIQGKQSSFTERSLYTGLADLSVIAVNPTATEITQITGRSNVKDPEYVGVNKNNNNRTLRLDFWLSDKEHNILTKVTYFLEDSNKTDKTGVKTQFINKTGKTAWAIQTEDLARYTWFESPYRAAKVGEEGLYEFLVALTNIDTTDPASEIVLDTSISDLVNNADIRELQEIVSSYTSNKVKVLLGVNDGQYQDVYNKVILRGGSSYVKKLAEQLKGYAWKSDYQGSFKFQAFTADLDGAMADSNASGSGDTKKDVTSLLSNM